MPDIGTASNPLDPSSVYYHDGSDWVPWRGELTDKSVMLYGYDGSNWVPLSVDASGHVIASDLALGASRADGQLPNSSTALYTVPAGKKAMLDQVWLFNTDGTTTYQAVLNIKRSGGTERTVCYFYLAADDGVQLSIGPLSAGDALYGQSNAANKINYVILGRLTP